MSRLFKRSALLLSLLVVAVLLLAWALLRGSLPRLDGELALPGLGAAVSIERDRLGVITIQAANERDALHALGFVHAQERYFEMDLMRRNAAGELAALLGPRMLATDRKRRMHRMRARVAGHLEAITGDRRPQLQAYAEGVNAGLAHLRVRPWPYLLLRQKPEPWQPADSALAGYAMYFDLQDSANARELALWKLERHLPAALFALLARDGTRWDAPLLGTARGDAALPSADEIDLRTLPTPDAAAAPARGTLPSAPEVGSNSFAVDGTLTRDGRALLADDMHSGLRAPNIWLRARLRYADGRAPRGMVDVTGFTLPGLPAVIAGSNGHVAWGFTNAYADGADWMRVRPCASASDAATRCAETVRHRETIEVAGGAPDVLEVVETAWGPLMHRLPDGEALALRWVAHLPGSLNFDLADLAAAGDLRQAFEAADRAAIPTGNLLVADAQGRIAWRVLGPLADRGPGCSSRRLVEDGDGAARMAPGQEENTPCAPWSVRTDRSPAVQDPLSGRLWTANNRQVDGQALARLGDGGYALGARASQVRDGLFSRDQFGERDLLAIQLDDRALFLQRWWRRLHVEAGRAGTPALRDLAGAAETWQGRAGTDSVGYRIVRDWRAAVHERIALGLTAPARAALGDAFDMPALPQLEGVAWPLVTEQPMHLLPRDFPSWAALFEDAAAEVRSQLAAHGALSARTWGERNTAAICHPLASAVPLLGRRRLCMPPDRLAGDSHMPRVAGPAFGATQRMVVSPGREADGIAHMPGGQSGHPLSPFWGAGHDDWVQGRPTPFLPGPARHRLQVMPAD
ncbi:penicillin acylase family protein [Luteimonas suaedae]|uniref:penicillin acylase family protein n=1 Tax=Luteimonas suaedae TaxID=2605430 RepID=UPI0011F08ED1|nr:penicillin acylase family protein [Luteimonas suaedae]